MANTDVLISGGGIAGPALACWLNRLGFSTTVVETAPAPRDGGQTVDLRGVARTVVERMDLMQRVRELSLDQRGLAFVDSRGRIAAQMPTELFGGEGIVSEIEILRGDLSRALYDASMPTTEYLFGESVTGFDEDSDGVTVTFRNAAPRRFGLIVGADGLHSAVRRLTFGPDSACVRSLDCYVAWFTTPSLAGLDLDGWFLMQNAPGGLVTSIRPGRLPGEIKAGLSYRSTTSGDNLADVPEQKDIVAARFADVGWVVPRLLGAMQSSTDFVLDSLGQVQLSSWSSGRAVLLGDAAYCASPLTGLGTSLALVGAHVLAGELGAAGGDHRLAFTRYEEVMRPYVTRGQKLPPGGVKGYAPMNAWAIRMRAASMSSMGRWPVRNLLARQFANGVRQSTGRAAKSRLIFLYHPSPDIGFFQRPFMLARALSWVASPPATISFKWPSCAFITSSAVLPWSGRSHGPPICSHVIVFISRTPLMLAEPGMRQPYVHRPVACFSDPAQCRGGSKRSTTTVTGVSAPRGWSSGHLTPSQTRRCPGLGSITVSLGVPNRRTIRSSP